MANVKKRTIAIVGVVVGVLTLRSWRNRRSEAEKPEPTDPTPDHDPAETATEHATAAVEHARTAGTKAVESVREEP